GGAVGLGLAVGPVAWRIRRVTGDHRAPDRRRERREDPDAADDDARPPGLPRAAHRPSLCGDAGTGRPRPSLGRGDPQPGVPVAGPAPAELWSTASLAPVPPGPAADPQRGRA